MPDTGSSPTKTFIRADGAGRTGGDLHQQQKAVAVKVRADLTDYELQEMADSLSNRLMLDGGNQPSAAIPFNDQRLTGLGAPTARTDAMRLDKVQDSTSVYGGTSTGTDTIAITLSPAITAYVAGQRFHFLAGGTNTGAATVNANTVGAKNLRKGPAGSVALAAGDITAGGMYDVEYDGTNMQLLNPGLGRNVSVYAATLLDDADAATARTTLGLGTISTQAASAVAITGGSVTGITDITVADGGTGSSTAAGARTNLGAVLTDAVFPGAIVAIIEDQKSSGTDGGTATFGSDQIRILNTLVYNRNTLVTQGGGTTGVGGTATQFTLPAGTWLIRWSTPSYAVGNFQSMLYDVTAGSVLSRGQSGTVDANIAVNAWSLGIYRVTVGSSNVYEIRHRSQFTRATLGMGIAASLGTEVYSRVEIYAA